MRIAIDASTLSTQGGPRTYLLGLLDALFSIDRENDYVLFYNDPVHLGRYPAAREIVLPGKSPLARLWREHVLLPLRCRKEKVDLLHCPKSTIPFFSPGCPVVVTLHDLIPVKHPELETKLASIYWGMHIPRAARKSDFIITISEWAKREIMTDYLVDEKRIAVIMQSFDQKMTDPRPELQSLEIRRRYALPAEYFLYVGTIQPRKNLATLVEAYQKLKQKRGTVIPLVIVGRKGWLYDDLFAKVKKFDLERDILFTGFVPDEELPFLFDGARAFVYISFFEGFGRPPLEAMACGVPVIASNTTAIPEVVGEAGILVPPDDVSRVAEAMESLLTNDSLATEFRSKGRLRAGLFSWESAALKTLEIYQRVAGVLR